MLKRHYIIFSLIFLALVNVALAQEAEKEKEKQKAKEKEWAVVSPELAPLRFSFGSDGYLGIYLEEVTAEKMKDLNLKEERGAVIMKVAEGSPAEKAGLKENDVIVSFNSRRVDTVRELQRLLGETPAGRTVSFEVVRGGSTQTLSATLSKRASNFQFFEGNKDLLKLQGQNQALAEKNLKLGELNRERAEEMRKRSQELQGRYREELQGKLKGFNSKEFGGLYAPKEFGSYNFNFNGFARGARLGVSVQSLTEQLGSYFGVKDGQGVLVTEVANDGAAAKAGLKAGDVILEADDQKVKDINDLMTALEKKEEGQVVLKVLRNHDDKKITVTLEKREVRPTKRRSALFTSQAVNVI
jgi:serine protease Do